MMEDDTEMTKPRLAAANLHYERALQGDTEEDLQYLIDIQELQDDLESDYNARIARERDGETPEEREHEKNR
eukprot:6488672-Amphidinium_carterae.6